MKPVDLTPKKINGACSTSARHFFFRNGSFLVEELVAKAK
jgi:hypothetical protein